MADVKISALPAVPVAVATTDLFAIVQGGVTYKATLTEVVTAITSTGLTATAGVLTVNLSTGVSGGQSVIGGTAASNSLTLSSTSNATKGKILFGTSAYDEANNRLGIGTQSPTVDFEINRSNNGRTSIIVTNTSTGALAGADIQTVNSVGSLLMLTTSTGYTPFQALLQNMGIIRSDSAITNGVGIIAGGLNPVTFGTNDLVRMRIFAGGNVFIGASPTDAGFRLDVNGTARIQGDLTISTKNIITDTTTGTKIGTATGQKLGFWNAAPIAQPTTTVTAATLVGGGGTNITDTDTFDGYTLQQIVKALRNAGLLA